MFAQALKMDAAALLSAFSPSKTCKVRVSSTRYRNDPYRARVAPYAFNPATPVFTGRKFAAPASIVPIVTPAKSPSTATTAAPSPVKAPLQSIATAYKNQQRSSAPRVVAVPAPVAAPVAAQPLVAELAPSKLVAAATAAPSAKMQPHYAMVGFKHEAAVYQAPFRVAAGDMVVVEADRGVHVGVVQSVTTAKPRFNVPSKIVRRAAPEDAQQCAQLKDKEARVTQQVQKLAESFGLGIRVHDVEFQTDSNKMTVFFHSKVFVDFRKLQRSLFRDYRCRIWLVNMAEVRPYEAVPVNPVQQLQHA